MIELKHCDICPHYRDDDFCIYCACNDVCLEGFTWTINEDCYEFEWAGRWWM